MLPTVVDPQGTIGQKTECRMVETECPRVTAWAAGQGRLQDRLWAWIPLLPGEQKGAPWAGTLREEMTWTPGIDIYVA